VVESLKYATETLETTLSSDNIKRLQEQIQKAESFHVGQATINKAFTALELAKQQLQMVIKLLRE